MIIDLLEMSTRFIVYGVVADTVVADVFFSALIFFPIFILPFCLACFLGLFSAFHI